jgi:membrane-bound lytic murein transglycosylase B
MNMWRLKMVIFFTVLAIVFPAINNAGIHFSKVNAKTTTQLSNAQAQKAALEAELAALEAEITSKQKELDGQKGQSKSLQNDIAILTTKINKAKLDIKAKNLVIQKLGGEINQKKETINELTEKIEREKESLAQLVRKTNEIDESNIVHLVLSGESLSGFYGDLDNFQSINRDIKDSVDSIRGVKTKTETEKKTLEQKQNAEEDARAALEAAQRAIQKSEKEKQQLLSISKNKEKQYQQLLAEKAKRRAQILSALFNLRDTKAIPFKDALEFATEASQKTGVRPAFLLAILTQESNLGTDQGSCYLADPLTGSGIGYKSGRTIANVMKPSRDVGPFMEITAQVGRDPFKTLVSCPIAGSGYGGAMGPSQFIPSTWKLLASRIAAALGVSSPDPWAPRDAFMASAIYLADLGADAQTYSAEKNAACRYYSGRACDSRKPANSFYGTSVMQKAQNIQENMIDPLSGN